MPAPPPPPLPKAFAHALPTWRAAYSDRTAAMMAYFAELAYVPFVDDTPRPAPGEKRPEEAGGWESLQNLIEPGGFEVVATFNKDNVQAFLALNPGELAVLAFRGTANLADWGINLNAILRPMPGFPGVEVHTGFWDTFHDLNGRPEEHMANVIKAAVDKYTSEPELGLYITGHSLGGALAQVASAVLERDNLAACYTFGSPRVGTLNFDRVVKCPHYRAVDDWDLVPGVPTPWPWGGYLHSGDPRLLKGKLPKLPSEALRRDQDVLPRFFHYIWSFLVWPFLRTLTIIDDHMIWNYRKRLDHIAELRAEDEIKAATVDLDTKDAAAKALAAVVAVTASPPPKPRALRKRPPKAPA
jgi:triacylglycerol lipase